MRMRSAGPSAVRLRMKDVRRDAPVHRTRRDYARYDGAHDDDGGDLGHRPRGADTG
jgi:hypothetical protein